MSRRKGYDVVVVGSGPGGASVTRELARGGARVLLLERGGDAPPTHRMQQQLREMCVPGRSLHVTGWGSVVVLSAHTLGGSSMYYFGSVDHPLDDVFLPVGVDLRADAAALSQELAPAPLPRELFGPRAAIIHDAARSLGHAWQPLPKLVDQGVLREKGLGAWREARFTARTFIDQAQEAGAQVRIRSTVHRVIIERGRATGVEVAGSGERSVVRADTVIVAAGGLATPGLLRVSGVPGTGRDFFYDPVMTVSGRLEGLDAGMEPPMVGALDKVATDGYMLTDLIRPRWLHNVFTALAGRPDRLLDYPKTISVMVKARDQLSGRITPRGRVDKPLTVADRAILDAGAEEAAEIVRATGARRLFRAGHVAVHPGGTAKIGEVVDSDLQTRVPGLYVCDASVIPSAWGHPPTLTVLALGRRLGRHLAAATPEGSRH